jgi:hypothetical protein
VHLFYQLLVTHTTGHLRAQQDVPYVDTAVAAVRCL